MADPFWLTIDAAAEYLGVVPETVRRMIDRGDLPAYRIKGSRLLRIDRLELETCLQPVAPRGGAHAV